jgi:hypothetical protein
MDRGIDLDGIFDPSKILKLEIYQHNSEVLQLFTNMRSLDLNNPS